MLIVAVCDDDADILNSLSTRIKMAFASRDIAVSVHPFTCPEQLSNELSTSRFDVFFLDIDMPEMDGIGLGELLRKRGEDTSIVFISNREERVFDSLKVAPLRFIRKNRFDDEIDETIDAINDRFDKKKTRFFAIPSQGNIRSIPIDDIIFAECQGKKLKILTTTQTLVSRGTMGELEQKLCGHGFLRPHNGFIVNYKHIDSISSPCIMLNNGVSIPLSKHKAKDIKQKFLRLISEDPDVLSPIVY